MDQVIAVLSHDALKEVIDQMPSKIDRANIQQRYELKKGQLKVADGSFINLPTSKKTSARRKSYFKILGLNSASQHIPLILKNLIQTTKEMKDRKQVEIIDAITICTNKIFMSILFGKDLENFLDTKYPYQTDKGTEMIDVCEFFSRIGHDMN